jgi:hypothetical protein
MKILNIFKSEPDDVTKTLVDIVSQDEEATAFPLYGEDPDYENLLDLIFENDSIISWW